MPERVERPKFKLATPEGYDPLDSPGKASARQFETAPDGVVGKSLAIKDGVSVDLRWIPAGDFQFGSNGETDAEYPMRPMRIESGFWMGTTEITNEQYALFDPSHDSRYTDELTKDHARPGIPANGPRQPVTRVGYDAAVRFCQWLDAELKAKGALPDGVEVRLPSEIEWEYAARAGSNDPFWYGALRTDFAQFANLADKSLTKMRVGQGSVDYWRKAPVDDGTVAIANVASYRANAFGLYDMIGNVAELTGSPWTPNGMAVQPRAETADRPGDLERIPRVVRGGSWKDWPERATSSFRTPVIPYFHAPDVGFRVIVAPK